MEKTYISIGSEDTDLSNNELEELLKDALSQALSDIKTQGKVIIIPPDTTRIHSRAGFLTEIAANQLGDKMGAVLPALGTHKPMSDSELSRMFGSVSKEKFIIHDWRNDVTELGRLEPSFVEKVSEGVVNYDWPVQVNKLLSPTTCKANGRTGGNFSLAVSIGQVVPHEVAGMANHAKNIFIGTGGKEAIDKSHYLGAAYGMERIMGNEQGSMNNEKRAYSPVRALFDEGLNRFGYLMPPILWVLTVIGKRVNDNSLAVRGLYIGFGQECFEKACELSKKVNVNLLEKQVNKIVVYLDPSEYRSTWLGNKAIYRTRMAMADGGELVILAPGLERFGEDLVIDRLIRKYGYRTRNEIIVLINTYLELAGNLSVAAHLIHGSPENRFSVRYCPGKGVTRQEIESVGYRWGDLDEELSRYDIGKLKAGWNVVGGEDFYYVENPALGLWII